MSEQRESGTLRSVFRVAIAIPAIFLMMILLKAVATIEQIYPLRRWLIKKGYLGYQPPDEKAIRHCSECDYRGVVAVDKHRPAPMSDINWELRCPKCSNTIEGPLFAEDVGEYVNQTRDSDVMGAMMGMGNYAAYKTVRTHNSRHALSQSQIRELREASNAE